MSRTSLGLLIAPLGTALAVSLLLVAQYLLGGQHDATFHHVILEVAVFSPIALALAYLMELIVALPLHRMLQDRRDGRLVSYLGTGVLAGATPFLLMILVTLASAMRFASDAAFWSAVEWWLSFVALGVACGILSALTFWLIVVRPQPR